MTGHDEVKSLADAAKVMYQYIPVEVRADIAPSIATPLYIPVTPEGAIRSIHQNLIKPHQRVARANYPNHFEEPLTLAFYRLDLEGKAMGTTNHVHGTQFMSSLYEFRDKDPDMAPYLLVRARLIRKLKASKQASDRVNIPYLPIDYCLTAAWLLNQWDDLENLTRKIEAVKNMYDINNRYGRPTHAWYKKFFHLTGAILTGADATD